LDNEGEVTKFHTDRSFNERMDQSVQKIYGNRLRVRACGFLVEDDALLLVNHKSLNAGNFWAPPGGGIEFSESADACLRREFREETGLLVEMVDFLFACEFIRPPLHAIELFFRVRKVGGRLKTGDDPESGKEERIITETRFITWKQIQEMAAGELHGIFDQVNPRKRVVDLKGYFKV
jgi:ADP-ribose pyrophosphatase YjhB (NUDIX family)